MMVYSQIVFSFVKFLLLGRAMSAYPTEQNLDVRLKKIKFSSEGSKFYPKIMVVFIVVMSCNLAKWPC